MQDVSHQGLVRSNLANTLRKLRRLDDARQEILLAIECKAPFGHTSEPWSSWANLADIETDASNPAAAAEAKRKAIACYLAYRRDGGENHSASGSASLAVTQFLIAGDLASANGDRALAVAPDLDYTMTDEILFLIETLEQPR